MTVTGLRKTYGYIGALEEVDLAIHAGEITAIVGDNGARKSTLVRIFRIHRRCSARYERILRAVR